MFEGEDCQTLQTLIDNETITHEHQKTPRQVLGTTDTSIKSKDHFWHFWDGLLLVVCQKPNEGIHALNTHITSLVNQCKFPDQITKETLKIMALRLRTGYTSKTSPSLHTRPSSHSANSWGPTARFSRRLRKKAMQSSLPWAQWPPQHPPYARMPSGSIPNVPSVATTIPQATAWPVARSAKDVMATTTSLPYAQEDHRDHPEVVEPSPCQMQEHHPNEDATSLAAGVRPPAPQMLQLKAQQNAFSQSVPQQFLLPSPFQLTKQEVFTLLPSPG